MAKLPRNISGSELIKALCKQGFFVVRQKGSHVVLRKPTPEGVTLVTVVPLRKNLEAGTLRAILRQAGLAPEDVFGT